MMDQSTNDHSKILPPPMSHYIPPSMPPNFIPNQQQQQIQQPLVTSEQPLNVQYPSAATGASEAEVAATNFNAQQQMAAMMQMQQQWATAGYSAPYMMQYPQAMMMMPPQQPGMDRPASRQSSRPPSRQSVTAPVSSSRSMVNGQAGGQQPQASSAQAMLPNQGYPGYVPPGMYNPWFDPYWQSMYASYQHPYSFGYTDEMMKYWKHMSQPDDDRRSHHSAAYSQSKQSQHSSSMQTWGSRDSLNDPYYQIPFANGNYPPKQQVTLNQSKREPKPNTDSKTLLTTAPVSNRQQISVESKTKNVNAPENGKEEDDDDEEEDDDDDDDDDEDDDEDESGNTSDDGSSDRFSIKSDLAQVNEESSRARRTPLLYIRPHLRAKFVFDQLIQVLPQSPSDTNQPATVEIVSANSIHSMAPSLVEERQLMSDFIGPLTASTAKSNVIRYCERQSQLATKSLHIIDRDALSILWQYMALLVKTNGVIDVRVDIPKILWSSSSPTVTDDSLANSNNISLSAGTSENSLREFLALGEIDTSIKFACENHLYTHALIISYLTDKQLFEKTIHNIISNLDNGDVLKTFYELGAGSIPSVVSNVTKAHYGDWRRHLAVILANRTDVNAQFVDLCVKTMGDTLMASGRIYAGHFCYLIANVPLGSYRNNADKIAVIGNVHAGQSNLSFATIPNLQLTEIYEYSLRKCSTTFIPLKIYYTSKLVLHGLKREALAYCEEIGQALIRQGDTSFVQLVDLQLFILIAEKSRAFSRNFQLDPMSYKEPTWLIELKRVIQSLIDNAFLNKTMRDDILDSSIQQTQTQVNREQNKLQATVPPIYPDKQTSLVNHQHEQTMATVPVPSAVVYAPPTITTTNTNIPNGYDTSNQISTEHTPYPNPPVTNYQNTLKVDTNVHYQPSTQPNYYQPPAQQQQQYYPSDAQQTEVTNYPQQWSQQPPIPSQTDLLSPPSQLPSTNNSFYQPPSADQSHYIQPGFTSTPNSYSSQQQQQQQPYTPGQNEQPRERLPSSETSVPSTREEPSQQTNGQIKKKHPMFDDGDDAFPNNSPKTSNGKSSTAAATTAAAAAANQTGPAEQKHGFVGNLLNRFGLKRLPQAHLPDDNNKTLKFDQQTGRWIDTSKSADEQAATQVKPPPMMSSNNTSSSFVPNPAQTQQPSAATAINPTMPPGSAQPPQSRTLSFGAGSTTIATSTVTPQTSTSAWPPQSTTNTAPITAQASQQQQHQQPKLQQPQQQQPQLQQPQPPQQQQQQQPQQSQQQKAPVQLSAAQQRLQAIRQQQQQAASQQIQAPPATSSNQYSLRNRQNQSRYVDVLASIKGAVAPTPNVSLNDLMPTPSTGMPTFAPTNQANNYFVPGSVQSTTDSHEQSSS